MEEPKHRRRAQQARLEVQPMEPAEASAVQSAPQRRRRAQLAAPEQQMMPEREALPKHEELPRRKALPQQNAQHEAQERARRQPSPPQKKRSVPTAENKTKSKRKAGYGQVLAKAAMGAAALLGIACAWAAHAIKRIGAALSRMKAQYAQISEENRQSGKKPAEKAAVPREYLRLATMAVCACVAVFSAWQVGSIVVRSVRTNRLNDSLAQQRAAIIEAQPKKAEPVDELEKNGPTAEPDAVPAVYLVEDTMEPVPENTPIPVASKAPDVVKTTKYRRIGGDALPEMAAMYEKNRDLVAWIQIPDVLDLPVVYRDNEYYLTRDFSKQKNVSGTIFLDKNHPFKEKTQNLLLHGHNMKDGTMFGRLAQYLHDGTYLRNHPFINFDTLWHKEQYVIFAVLNVSLTPTDPRFFNYFTHDVFTSDTQFSAYIRQLQLRSEYAIPIDVVPSDALLTLSTCLEDDRLVIVARRLRENETRSELRELIRMATRQ